jgi:hypothetical protein
MMSSRQGKTIYQFIDDHVLTDKSSFEIVELIEMSPFFVTEGKNNEAIEWFCYHFDLGDWFIEALIENDVNIFEALKNTQARKEVEEQEATADRLEIDRDLRLSQGAAY